MKQPKVPLLREEGQLAVYIRELILFLKDFCIETWTADRARDEQLQALRKEMTRLAEQTRREAIDGALPVGLVVSFADATDPNALYPWQTWTQIRDGRVEIAADEAHPLGSTGGEQTHTLTADELPAHTHAITTYYGGVGNGAVVQRGWGGETAKSEIASLSCGGGAAHNNMPPYVARNVWQRTA